MYICCRGTSEPPPHLVGFQASGFITSFITTFPYLVGHMAETSPHESKRERVILTPLGRLTTVEESSAASSSSSSSLSSEIPPDKRSLRWREWPSNEFFITALQPYQQHLLPGLDATSQEEDWQGQARRALLQECGFLERGNTATETDGIGLVQSKWERAINLAIPTNHNNNDDAKNGENNSVAEENDLIEFFRNGGKSNDRQLEWALMDCAPGCQFQLHAHPNLELVYCLKGELHEVRLVEEEGVDLPRDFETTGEQTTNRNPQVLGPSLLGCSRPWRFGTLSQGQWLVNRVGTIHKSFTATNGDGCILLALWGGAHANILQEPSVVVQAVEAMDRKLNCSCRGGEWISETFLPDSEKASSLASIE